MKSPIRLLNLRGKTLTISLGIILFLFLLFTGLQNKNQFIDSDHIINGSFTIEKGRQIILKNKAKLTVFGDMQIKGALICEEGPLYLEVNGNLLVDGQIRCQRTRLKNPPKDPGIAILLAVKRSINFTRNSQVLANGHIEITNTSQNFLLSRKSLDQAFDQVILDNPANLSLGPLWNKKLDNPPENFLFPLVSEENIEKSNTEQIININGNWILGDPKEISSKELKLLKTPPNLEKIVLLYYFPHSKIEFTNTKITLQDGQKGSNIEKGCEVVVPEETKTDAPRMLVLANSIFINNLSLRLGNGGKGGNAETAKECFSSKAVGGSGGLPGDFKMISKQNFSIKGRFNLYPGSTGDGGMATIYSLLGKSCGKLEKEGNLIAEGGKGLDNLQTLKYSPNISDIQNIFLGDIRGGHGGNVFLYRGNENKGQLTGGTGGKALIQFPETIDRTEDADGDRNGLDGKTEIVQISPMPKDLNCID